MQIFHLISIDLFAADSYDQIESPPLYVDMSRSRSNPSQPVLEDDQLEPISDQDHEAAEDDGILGTELD